MHSKSFVVVDNGIVTSSYSLFEYSFKDLKKFFEHLLNVFEGRGRHCTGDAYVNVMLTIHPDRNDFIIDTEFTISKYNPEYTVTYSRDKIEKHTIILDDLQAACNFLIHNVLFANPNDNEHVEFVEKKDIGEQLPLNLSV